MMPRAKRKKVEPIDRFVIQVDGQDLVCEVWDKFADEGTRGAHMRQKRDRVMDAVLIYCEDGLAGNSNIAKDKVNRLLQGQESLSAFAKIIKTIARTQRVTIKKTLSEEIAKSVRRHYMAIDAALADIKNKK